jgi:hypothetical protein
VLSQGDSLRLLACGAQNTRMMRIAPLHGPFIACCTSFHGNTDCTGPDSVCLRTSAHLSQPHGCAQREQCTVLTGKVGGAGEVVDLSLAQPPVGVRVLNVGAVRGSTVGFCKRKHALFAGIWEKSTIPNDVQSHAAVREGWYFGVLLSSAGRSYHAPGHAANVLMRATGETETVPLGELSVLDSAWIMAAGEVRLEPPICLTHARCLESRALSLWQAGRSA